jgi:ParB family chromosome partitioning protein
LAAGEASEQVAFAREITGRRLSKSAAEQLAAARRPSGRRRGASGGDDVHVRALADELTRGLGTRVRITPRERGGVIEIEFYSPPELDRLVTLLGAVVRARGGAGGDRARAGEAL